MKLSVRQVAADIKVRFAVHAAPGSRDAFRRQHGLDPLQALLEIELLASQVDTKQLRFAVDIIDRIAKLVSNPQSIKGSPRDFAAVERAIGASFSALSDIYCDPASWIEDHSKYSAGVVAARLETINSCQGQFVEGTVRAVLSSRSNDSGEFLRWFTAAAEDLAFDVKKDFDQFVHEPVDELIESLTKGDWAESFEAIDAAQHYLLRFPIRELYFITGTAHQLDNGELSCATDMVTNALSALPEPLGPLGAAAAGLVKIIQRLGKERLSFLRSIKADTSSAPWVVGRWDSADGGRQVVTMVNPYAIAGQVKQVVILSDGVEWLEQRIAEMIRICLENRKRLSERDRVDWIRSYGSDQLRRQVLENYTWTRAYNLELYQHWSAPIQTALQGLVTQAVLLFGSIDIDMLPRHSPTSEAFAIRDLCAQAGAEADIVFCKRHKELPEPGVEAVRVRPPGPLAESWILVGRLALADALERENKKKKAGKG